MSKLVYRLKTLFDSYDLSTVTGQQALEISKTQLGRYLSGFYVPSLKNAIKICDYFDCSLDYLLGIDEEKNRFGNFEEPNFEIFSKRFLQILSEHNLSIYQVAKKLEINRNNWTYWNKKKTLPTLETIYKLAKEFEVSAEFLIGRTKIKKGSL